MKRSVSLIDAFKLILTALIVLSFLGNLTTGVFPWRGALVGLLIFGGYSLYKRRKRA